MPPERSDAAALYDMLQAARTVLRYIEGKSRNDLDRDDLLRHAIERNLEIIGEAARRLTAHFLDEHPEIPWQKIMATRHILAHDYGAVDQDIVWRILTDHVPALIGQIEPLLPPPPPTASAD